MGSETSQYHEEKKRRGSIIILQLDASRGKMIDRARIPKVVASEMGAVQTYDMKPIKIFLRKEGDEAKDASRCVVGVVSSVRSVSGETGR